MTVRNELRALAQAAADQKLPHSDPAWQRRQVDPVLARSAAVLMLFGVLDHIDAAAAADTGKRVPADLDVLLMKRAAGLTNHPSQVSFPGGGVEPQDASPQAAALREAVEETGLDPTGVEILGSLPQVGLPVSNFLVTPVLAWWASPSPVDVVDYAESAQVFRVPVRDLLDPANRYTAVVNRPERVFHSPSFSVNNVLVWGFTGMVLNQLFDQLGWTLPWDESRHIKPPL